MTTSTGLQRWLSKTRPVTQEASAWADGGSLSAGPSTALRLLASHRPEEPNSWLDRGGQFLQAWAGRWTRPLGRLQSLSRRVQALAEGLPLLSEAEFSKATVLAMGQCKVQPREPQQREVIDADLQALAMVAEAVRRAHGFTPYPVQLLGVLALLEGRMAEMATGEGKTLTAAMAAVVAAWRGLPCHVVTANDYLAARDAQIGQPLFALCQVSVASVTDQTPPPARAAAYAHDIVYTTAKDLLADHLRDALALGRGAYRARFALSAARQGGHASVQGTVMRGIYQVIVDEADSVLIDEAVTPLIISAQRPDALLEQAAQEAVLLAKRLRTGQDFLLQQAMRHIEWTREGRQRLGEMAQGMPAFWRRTDRAEELVQMALYAMHLMVRDKHFVVDEEKVILVDELTGRLAQQRTLSLGMQQVLEASLGLPVSAPTAVSARSSFQRFFKRFDRLGGMTGTAREARSEFAKVYGLTLVAVPTHRPLQRRTLKPLIFAHEALKFEAIAQECEALVLQGRAVLIGVRSVRASLALERCLRDRLAASHLQVLHALEHASESAVVARAGQAGMVTIATNMAGRGTDIALEPAVRERGGLHVIVAEVNDFGRIDRQLVGRCARQGDPGTVRVFVSLDDELFQRFLPKYVCRAWQLANAHGPVLQASVSRIMIAWAQRRAEKLASYQRRMILEQDTELERNGF